MQQIPTYKFTTTEQEILKESYKILHEFCDKMSSCHACILYTTTDHCCLGNIQDLCHNMDTLIIS